MLDGLGVAVSGLTPNPRALEYHTNHCWRLVRREDSCLSICHVCRTFFEDKSVERVPTLVFGSASEDLPRYDKKNEVQWNVVELGQEDSSLVS
jgi:hypothetical protein